VQDAQDGSSSSKQMETKEVPSQDDSPSPSGESSLFAGVKDPEYTTCHFDKQEETEELEPIRARRGNSYIPPEESEDQTESQEEDDKGEEEKEEYEEKEEKHEDDDDDDDDDLHVRVRNLELKIAEIEHERYFPTPNPGYGQFHVQIIASQKIDIISLKEENKKLKEKVEQLTERVTKLEQERFVCPKPSPVPKPVPKPVARPSPASPSPKPVPKRVVPKPPIREPNGLGSSDLVVPEGQRQYSLKEVEDGKFPYTGTNPNPYVLLDDEAFITLVGVSKEEYVKMARSRRNIKRVRFYERIQKYSNADKTKKP